jgi:hypothetical protein
MSFKTLPSICTRLLRPCPYRPPCRAAEQPDELAATE